jgi:hypothetical protein
MRALRSITKVLPYFLAGFALFAVIGFIAGWGKRAEHAREQIYRELTLGRDVGGYSLAHQCDGRRTYGYLVDRDELRPEWSERVAALAASAKPSARHLAHRELALSLVGGASAGITWRDLSKVRAASTSRWLYVARVAAGIVGGVSGYSVGYFSGSRFGIDCDSGLARELLNDPAEWRRFETSWIVFGLTELAFGDRPRFWNDSFKNINPLEDDPVFACKTSLYAGVLAVRNAIQADEINPGDREFESLYALKRKYEAVVGSPEYARIQKLKLAKAVADRGDPPDALMRHFDYSPQSWAAACQRLEAVIARAVP